MTADHPALPGSSTPEAGLRRPADRLTGTVTRQAVDRHVCGCCAAPGEVRADIDTRVRALHAELHPAAAAR